MAKMYRVNLTGQEALVIKGLLEQITLKGQDAILIGDLLKKILKVVEQHEQEIAKKLDVDESIGEFVINDNE